MVSATENALINTPPLAVVWVWVCFSEGPSIANFTGGMIVMAAVVGHVWHSNQSRDPSSLRTDGTPHQVLAAVQTTATKAWRIKLLRSVHCSRPESVPDRPGVDGRGLAVVPC